MKKKFLVCLLLFLFAANASLFAKPKYKIRYLLTLSMDTSYGKAANLFKQIVEKKTHGDVEVTVYANANLEGKKVDQLSSVKLLSEGKLEMADSDTSPLMNFNPKLGVLNLPFLFKTQKQVDDVYDGPIGKKLFAGLLPNHIHGLAYDYFGFRIICTKNLKIHRPQDLKGARIRTTEGSVTAATYASWGVTPVPAPVIKVVEMAQKGYIDGADRSWPTWWDLKQYTVLKVVNQTYHAVDANAIIINEDFFQSLPKSYQKIVENAAETAAKLQRKLYLEEQTLVQKEAPKMGVKVVILTPAERKVFEENAKPVYSQFENIIGKDLIEAVRRTK